ncbi:MAG TPA: tetratricopeptide repeat protein [Candidatus Polarisedimenticolia bacterium]|nr:tetratricopeptide repeat protein [Candidatus Polarisedimenticolia bacterium]
MAQKYNRAFKEVSTRLRLLHWVAAGLAAALYLGGVDNGFVFDDDYIVKNNPQVTGEAGLTSLLTSHYWAGEDKTGNLYRPITVASFRLTHLLAGEAPWAHHLVNVLLHALAAALVCRLALRLGGSSRLALVTGLLFAAHPVLTEAVDAIVGRADLLAAVFVLTAWLVRRRTGLALASFALGLLSKENAVVLPGLLALEDILSKRLRHTWRRLTLFLIPLALYLVARLAVLGSPLGSAEGPFNETTLAQRIMTAVVVLARYLGLLIYPGTLSADYSFDQIPLVETVFDPRLWLAAAVVGACLGLALAVRRRLPAVTCGLAIFFIAILPVSNLLFGIGVVMAERLVYLPAFGVLLAVAALLCWIWERARSSRRMVAVALVVVAAVAGLGATTVRRHHVWQDQLSLFTATVRDSPRSALAHMGLAAALSAAGRFEEAENEYREALSIQPRLAPAHYNLALMMERRGLVQEATASYRETVRSDPHHWRAMNNLGILLHRQGKLEEAATSFRSAANVAPPAAAATAQVSLGVVLEAMGRNLEALEAYAAALRIVGDDVEALTNRGRLLVGLGKAAEAIPLLERAASLNPGSPVPAVNLAAAWLAVGDQTRCGEILDRVLAQHPSDQAALRVREAWRARRSEATVSP